MQWSQEQRIRPEQTTAQLRVLGENASASLESIKRLESIALRKTNGSKGLEDRE
jgi:hypothetical protein